MTIAELSELEKVCRKFIDDNKISCADAIGQCDHIQIAAPELVYHVCEILGYYKYPEDEAQ